MGGSLIGGVWGFGLCIGLWVGLLGGGIFGGGCGGCLGGCGGVMWVCLVRLGEVGMGCFYMWVEFWVCFN